MCYTYRTDMILTLHKKMKKKKKKRRGYPMRLFSIAGKKCFCVYIYICGYAAMLFYATCIL